MSMRNLDALFRPRSVAVIGASENPDSVGTRVLSNLRDGTYTGQVFAVNPKYARLGSIPCYRHLADISSPVDLAVICTPADTVPLLVEQLGAAGTKAAIVLSAGLFERPARNKETLCASMLSAARPHLMRILGPNCLGILIPGLGLNASFAQSMALPGHIAFISQSGAMATAVLDWANSREIGFSHFITLGDSADIDVGDLLDYMAQSTEVRAVLIYLESVLAGRKFLSAARRVARIKPVVVVKAGRADQGARAARTHSGALAGSDVVYDAALRRAGLLRVRTTDDVFAAVETLSHARPLRGERLAIVTNGGGMGVMATDSLNDAEVTLAELDSTTIGQLDRLLPKTWSHGNPIDIVGDASAARYAQVAKCILTTQDSDAVLFIHAPTAVVTSDEVATAILPAIKAAMHTVFTAWPGGTSATRGKKICQLAGVPVYETPEQAVQAFANTVEHRRNQTMLLETPILQPDLSPSRIADTQVQIRSALSDNAAFLPGLAAQQVLRAYGIPCLDSRLARDADEAVALAEEVGYPIAVKIYSEAIVHKSDIGGVVLDIENAAQLCLAIAAIEHRARHLRPDSHILGYLIQKMIRRPQATELFVGTAVDPVFGPVVVVGHGGTAVEILADRSAGIVPLNSVLALDMLKRTAVFRLLGPYRGRPAADLDAVCQVIIRLSDIMVELPEISAIDINPLLVDEKGAIAMDVRISVDRYAGAAEGRLAILPYPSHLSETVGWRGSTLTIRAARPQDERVYKQFFAAMTPEDVRHRFFGMIRQLRHQDLASMTQLDYDREIALVALITLPDGSPCLLAEARAATDPDNEVAEFAIMVRSDSKRCGLGAILLTRLIGYCRSRGTRWLCGTAMRSNAAMLRLARQCGFTVEDRPEEGEVSLQLPLTERKRPIDV